MFFPALSGNVAAFPACREVLYLAIVAWRRFAATPGILFSPGLPFRRMKSIACFPSNVHN